MSTSTQIEDAINTSYTVSISNLEFQQSQISETVQRLQNKKSEIDSKIKALKTKRGKFSNSENEENDLESELALIEVELQSYISLKTAFKPTIVSPFKFKIGNINTIGSTLLIQIQQN